MAKNTYLILLILIFLTLLINGCSYDGAVICNKPYINYETRCCLDQNDNSICDYDEQITQYAQPVQAQEEPQQEEQTYEEPETIPEEIPEETTIITTALVSRVVDGDTIELSTGEDVRLLGINTPERGQPYYDEATDRLTELIWGKTITLEKDVTDKDQYGRLLRHVFLGNSHINLIMVKEGFANVYIVSPNLKYENELEQAQEYAKNAQKGIWASVQTETNEDICDNTCIGINYFHWNAQGDDCINLNDEYVTFRNSCSYSCDLKGWTIKDEANHIYTFPSFTLDENSLVTIYTGVGSNSNSKLYWANNVGTCKAIWNNDGDTLFLRNSAGALVLDYSYAGFE